MRRAEQHGSTLGRCRDFCHGRYHRALSDVHSACYPKGTSRNFMLIRAVGAWNTNLYLVSRWRAYETISLLTCKLVSCCGKPSRRYREQAIF